MSRFKFACGLLLTVFMGFSAFLALGTARGQGDDDHKPHWTYEGEEGPAHWGELADDYVECADGTAQSPINITQGLALDLTNIEFDFGQTALTLQNNGHTIQAEVDAGSTVTYNEITYNLLQFHFHHPSEHLIEGKAANMEIHFVHQDPHSGNLAVIGVLVVAGEENSAYAEIMDNLPLVEGEPVETGLTIVLSDLLPDHLTYATYQGSLTTPPCSEIVRWLVLSTPIELSDAQIEDFSALFDMNARPVQALNTRDLLVDVTE